MATLHFPHAHRTILAPFLPPHAYTPSASPLQHPHGQQSQPSCSSDRPFVTLTYAQSLDSQIALSPNQQTALSGPSSKAMTHYLRSAHDAILVGSGTAIADDPSLNCRLDDVIEHLASLSGSGDDSLFGQPRPVVLDRRSRWAVGSSSKVVRLAMEGRGKGPWVIIARDSTHSISGEKKEAVEAAGGAVLTLDGQDGFPAVLDILAARAIRSVMVEGGAMLINEILSKYTDLVDSVIVTIAPVLLGAGGLVICPTREDPRTRAASFYDVHYLPLDRDVVMCGRIQKDSV